MRSPGNQRLLSVLGRQPCCCWLWTSSDAALCPAGLCGKRACASVLQTETLLAARCQVGRCPKTPREVLLLGEGLPLAWVGGRRWRCSVQEREARSQQRALCPRSCLPTAPAPPREPRDSFRMLSVRVKLAFVLSCRNSLKLRFLERPSDGPRLG